MILLIAFYGKLLIFSDMDPPGLEYLDDTTCSQAIKSPVKTSTVLKENTKWYVWTLFSVYFYL